MDSIRGMESYRLQQILPLRLRCCLWRWRRGGGADQQARPGEVAGDAGAAGGVPDGVAVVVGADLAHGGYPPADHVRDGIVGEEGFRNDVLGVGNIVDQLAAFTLGHVLDRDFVDLVLAQGADGRPLQGDRSGLVGERRAVRGQQQAGLGIGRRDGGRGCGAAGVGLEAERDNQPLTQPDDVVDQAVVFDDGVLGDGVVGGDAAEGVVFLHRVFQLLAGLFSRLVRAESGRGQGGRRGCGVRYG